MKFQTLFLAIGFIFSSQATSLALRQYTLPEKILDKSLLELPAIQEKDIIIIYDAFTINYNDKKLIPNWVAYELTSDEAFGKVPRAKGFSMDLDYDGRQAMREDYSNSGWDKGHMAPAADMKWSETAMKESFYLTNICPQNHDLNAKDWQTLEKMVRDWAIKYGKIWVVCGPFIGGNIYGTIGEQRVAVPDVFFKAVLRKEDDRWYSIAFVFENDSHKQPVKDAVVSVNDVEALIGYDLFTNLDNRIEETVEAQSNWDDWNDWN